ncbi:5'-nucleotidase-like [Amphibalanus amphitrite]|uniref:5'-nucleotidase-like n=1 Tax=Amphibalanus amphitrite TaxID=1232801 RepID=UPI001C90BF52|nr:5'-nucleotidase-like [Amphibalanus amphitrite]
MNSELLSGVESSACDGRSCRQWHVLVLNAAGADLGLPADAHAVGVQSMGGLGSVPLVSHVGGPTVAANLQLPAPLATAVTASVTLEVGAAGRVGLVGVVPTSLEAGRAGGAVTDPLQAVGQEAARLRAAGVGTVLALGRLDGETALQVAQRLPGLDGLVIPGGLRPHAVYPLPVGRDAGGALPLLEAPLVAAPGYLGVVTLTLAADGRVSGWRGRVLPIRAPAPAPPPAAAPPVAAGTGFCPPVADQVGATLSELDGRIDSCSQRECSLGSTLADALLLAAVTPSASSWSEVSLAVLSAGALSSSLPRCAVSEADLAAAVATNATAVTLSLAGIHLRQVFEVSAAGRGSAAFLQTAGVRVVYDMTRPAGRRVRRLEVLCSQCVTPRYEEVRAGAMYRLVTTSYLAAGGHGYRVLPRRGRAVADSGRPVRDILRHYLRSRSPVPPPTGGRVFFSGQDGPVSDPPARSPTASTSTERTTTAAAAVTSTAAPPAGGTRPAETIGEALQSTSVSQMVLNSALWSLSGFFMLGMMITAFF